MIGTVVAKEATEFGRDRRLTLLLLLTALLALGAIIIGAFEVSRHAANRAEAIQADQAIWRSQGEVNPHSAAHFGMFAFKPQAPLTLFDPGLTPWQGEAVWIEAHYQNPAQARPAERSTLVQRFGDLSPAWLLQVLMPLFIILAGFAAVAGDRERGSLRLQLVQGMSARRLVAGKGLALFGAAGAIVLVLLLVGGVAALLVAPSTADLLIRWTGLAIAYSAYAGIWTLIVLGVSIAARTGRQALVVLLGIWIASAVFIPRIAADAAAAAHPTASAGTFWDDVRVAREEGVDGHDPGDERAKALEAAVLKRYGVNKVEELPIDFGGVALQAGEDYGNRVFDRLYGELAAQEQAQARTQLLFAVLSPTLAVRPLSMGLAGTDTAHQLAFTDAAEAHRRGVQRRLNDEQARSGKGQNFKNKVAADFWTKIRTFTYGTPRITELAAIYAVPAFVMLIWLALAGAAVTWLIRRMERSL